MLVGLKRCSSLFCHLRQDVFPEIARDSRGNTHFFFYQRYRYTLLTLGELILSSLGRFSQPDFDIQTRRDRGDQGLTLFPPETSSSDTLGNSLSEDYDLLKDTQLVRGGARAGLRALST